MSTQPTSAQVAAAIVADAVSQLGVPYVFGGEDPGVGFDCSGLAQWCCFQQNITGMPRGSAAQYTYGPNIETLVLWQQPMLAGDLVFYWGGEWEGPRPGHVGICTTPPAPGTTTGEMIDAPYTGVDVRYDPFDTSVQFGPLAFMGATRPALIVGTPPLPPQTQEETMYMVKLLGTTGPWFLVMANPAPGESPLIKRQMTSIYQMNAGNTLGFVEKDLTQNEFDAIPTVV